MIVFNSAVQLLPENLRKFGRSITTYHFNDDIGVASIWLIRETCLWHCWWEIKEMAYEVWHI